MLKFRLDRLSLEKLYLSFIRPLLEYGDVVWDPHNMYLINIDVYDISHLRVAGYS
jgi:hypothetical protein